MAKMLLEKEFLQAQLNTLKSQNKSLKEQPPPYSATYFPQIPKSPPPLIKDPPLILRFIFII